MSAVSTHELHDNGQSSATVVFAGNDSSNVLKSVEHSARKPQTGPLFSELS
jgi:hypothetical protein